MDISRSIPDEVSLATLDAGRIRVGVGKRVQNLLIS